MRKQLFALIAGVAFFSLGGLTFDGSEALADPVDPSGIGAFCVFDATAFDVDVCVTFFQLLSNPNPRLGPVAACKLLQFTSPELFDELWKNFGDCVKTLTAQ